MKKYLAAAFIFLLLFIAFLFSRSNFNNFRQKDSLRGMTESEARKIAETTCVKGGESVKPGTYNENTRTWWFDANLNVVKEGCNPACVVSEDTGTAEINWRCTGLVNEEGKKEIKCGSRSQYGDVCAEIYEPVCALVEVQCIKAPCEPVRQTFSNSCRACSNSLTKSYYSGVCEETVDKESVLRQLFIQKYPKYKDTLTIKIGLEDNDHARGSVSFVPGGEGGIFLAVRSENEWKIVHEGNGQIPCSLSEYGFGEEYLSDCSN